MSSSPSAALAAVLSFLWPGLGQISGGRRRRGVLLALPALIALGAALVAAISSPADVLDLLVREDVLVALIVANFLFLAYRLVAIADAWRLATRADRTRTATRGLSVATLSALLLATVAMHGAIGYVGIEAYEAEGAFFLPGGNTGFEIPEPSWSPSPSPPGGATTGPGASAAPSPTPGPKWAEDGRLNLLLIGSDNGPGRWSLRTDTMILLSVDQASGRAALFGIPRNITNVPLPAESAKAFSCRCFPGLLNALYVYAEGHPNQFPGSDTPGSRGFRAVTGAIQELVGVPLDGMVGVSLQGFVRLVNAVGGLWIDVPSSLYDDHYPHENGTGDITISIHAGCQRLNGHLALAYARSRHQDSDYGRMARQQRVVVALRRQLDPMKVLPKAPELIDIARDTLFTTLERSDIASLARLAATVDSKSIQRILFVPPTYPEFLTTSAVTKIRDVVRSAFIGGAMAPAPDDASPTPTLAGHCG